MIEPSLKEEEEDILEVMKEILVDSLEFIEDASPEFKEKYLRDAINSLLVDMNLNLNPVSKERITYYVLRDFIRYGPIDVPMIVLHYMEHGSFSYSGDVHGKGRIDVALLKKILEMPQQCGDLGTIFSPADVNKDCIVDINDVNDFIIMWLEEISP